MPITEQSFRETLGPKLGDNLERAVIVFRNCGVNLAPDVLDVLRHAADQGKVDLVLGDLEAHYSEFLMHQHPHFRGTVEVRGVNPTREILNDIYKYTLGLDIQPHIASD